MLGYRGNKVFVGLVNLLPGVSHVFMESKNLPSIMCRPCPATGCLVPFILILGWLGRSNPLYSLSYSYFILDCVRPNQSMSADTIHYSLLPDMRNRGQRKERG